MDEAKILEWASIAGLLEGGFNTPYGSIGHPRISGILSFARLVAEAERERIIATEECVRGAAEEGLQALFEKCQTIPAPDLVAGPEVAFRYPRDHEAGRTLTVGGLRKALEAYQDGLPVFAAWEGVLAYIRKDCFSVRAEHKGLAEDKRDCLVIDVGEY